MTDDENTEETAEEADGAKDDDTPEREDDAGEKGLGSESGAVGGEESPPTNADPSTQGAVKGTEGPL